MSQQQYTVHTKKPILAITFFFMSIQSLNYSIENKTDGQIQILIEYEGSSICTAAERIIAQNRHAVIKAGPCQIHSISIKKIRENSSYQCYFLTIPKESSQKDILITITNKSVPPQDHSQIFLSK
jgi:hypothetical protein